MNTSPESLAPRRTPITAQQVAEDARIEVLPRHFGRQMLRVEDAVYTFLRHLAVEYRGGFWQFYELSNGGFYMAPQVEPLRVKVSANGYDGQMSADAAGITACLFALSHLSFCIPDETITRHFHLLRDFALEHVEAAAILAAID